MKLLPLVILLGALSSLHCSSAVTLHRAVSHKICRYWKTLYNYILMRKYIIKHGFESTKKRLGSNGTVRNMHGALQEYGL